MCNIAPGMPHEITGLQPTRESMNNSSGFFKELIRRGSATADEAYYRRYDPERMDSGSRNAGGVGPYESCNTGCAGAFDACCAGSAGSSDVCKGNGPADLIFVTGYFGAPIIETATQIAQQEGLNLLLLDRAIEEKDGRSIKRLCMAGGEHGYRNLEYEAVQEISEAYGEGGRDCAGEGGCDCVGEGGRVCAGEGGRVCAGEGGGDGLVIACGDGILYDEMTRDIILGHDLIIVGEDMSESKLWKGACTDDETWHAFMFFGTEEQKRQAFGEYHARQKELFRQTKAARAR